MGSFFYDSFKSDPLICQLPELYLGEGDEISETPGDRYRTVGLFGLEMATAFNTLDRVGQRSRTKQLSFSFSGS